MAKNHIITGLDIGTSSIKAIIVQKKPNSEGFEVLSKISKPNSGMRRGIIAKPEEVSGNISLVLDQARAESGQKIEDVYVNIGGSHIFLTSSCGSIVVSRVDRSISREDINRAIDSAKTFSLPPNREIIDFFPKHYIVDGESGIKEPLGMRGTKLEAEILAVGVFSPYFRNLTDAVLNSGVHIADVICSSISSAKSCLTPQQKELGVALLDIGAATTDVAIYEEGDLIHLMVIPVGSGHITNDIAIGLRTDIAIAEQIKREFGSYPKSHSKKSSPKIKKSEKIEVPAASLARSSFASQNLGGLAFSSKLLNKIIDARICETFALAQKEIKNVSSGILPAGVVITGGGAKLPYIVDLAKKQMKLPCRIGIPARQILTGEPGKLDFPLEPAGEEDPSFSACWGLVLSGLEELSGENPSNFKKGIGNKIKRVFRVFIP